MCNPGEVGDPQPHLVHPLHQGHEDAMDRAGMLDARVLLHHYQLAGQVEDVSLREVEQGIAQLLESCPRGGKLFFEPANPLIAFGHADTQFRVTGVDDPVSGPAAVYAICVILLRLNAKPASRPCAAESPAEA